MLAAEFVNGWTDAPNAIATVVSTRVLSPSLAVLMAAVLNIVGALVTGTAVAATIGKGIVRPEVIGLPVVAAATLTVVVWSTAPGSTGYPPAKAMSLLPGLLEPDWPLPVPRFYSGKDGARCLSVLASPPFLAFSLGMVVMTSLYWILRRARPSLIRNAFSRLQILSAAFMAFSHGSNDGQKFMGVFALALVLGGVMAQFAVPVWVMLLCGAVMGIGTAFGGWRIIRTMGFKITKLEPVNGFAAETSGSIAILLASPFGIPLSTTHCIGTSIMGVGATKRFSAVRWGMAGNIVMAWIITFPVCFALGYLFTWLLGIIF